MVGQASRDIDNNGNYAPQQLRRSHALFLGGGILCDEILGQATAMAFQRAWPFDLLIQEDRRGAKANGDAAHYEESGTSEDADRHLRRFSLCVDFLLRGLPLHPDGRICSPKPL